MTPRLAETLLRAEHSAESVNVLPRKNVGAIRHAYSYIVDRAGLGPCQNIHKLRHTYCTRLAEASGGDVQLVSQMARHTSVSVTQKYLHNDRRQAGVDLLAGLAIKPPKNAETIANPSNPAPESFADVLARELAE